jgi:hypothetical protein
LKSFLQENEKSSRNLYTRESQRKLWNEVFSYSEEKEGNGVIVLGNPGIGKSRSMTYLLKILLENKKQIIYEARKDRILYSFIPKDDGSYEVFSLSLKEFDPIKCEILKNPNSYYLIDPDLPQSITNVPAHKILAASPQKAHYHEFQKTPGTDIMWMKSWNKEELKVLQNKIKIDSKFLNDQEFNERYFYFGGRIRFIFANKIDYDKYFIHLIEALKNLTFDNLINTLCGTINFKIEGLSYIFNQYLDKEQRELGTEIASEYSHLKIIKKYWEAITNLLDPNSPSYSSSNSSHGYFFEKLALKLLEFENKFDVYNLSHKIDHTLKLCEAKLKISNSKNWDSYLKECSKLNSAKNSNKEREIILPNLSNQPVIDALDSNNRGYQITVSKKHKINRNQLQNIFENFEINENNPFKLYFIIPESIKNEFKPKFTESYNKLVKKEILEIEKENKDFKGVNNDKLIEQILKEKNLENEKTTKIIDEQFIKIYYILMPKKLDENKINKIINKFKK